MDIFIINTSTIIMCHKCDDYCQSFDTLKQHKSELVRKQIIKLEQSRDLFNNKEQIIIQLRQLLDDIAKAEFLFTTGEDANLCTHRLDLIAFVKELNRVIYPNMYARGQNI